jgi:hypothetical protein
MKATYLWLARLIALGVVLQAAFIAYGMFEILNDADNGQLFTGDRDEYTIGMNLHGIFGMVIIPLLALVLLIVAFFAKVPRGVRMAAAVFGLVVLQFVLAAVSLPVPAIGLLHGLNAFAIAGVAGFAGRFAGQAGSPGGPDAVAPDAQAPAAA